MSVARSEERGQVLPLVALVLVVLGAAALVLGRIGEAVVHRGTARTAADAAALAGAAAGEDAARRLAEANGARLVAYDRRGDTVWVTVRRGPAVASAAAERSPPGAVAPPPSG